MMAIRKTDGPLTWQSKTILLLVLPWTAGSVVLQSHWWLTQVPVVAYETLGISALFGLIVWRMRAGTPGAALTGAVITASLMYSTVQFPYKTSWLHGGLMPLLAVFLLTYAATKVGRGKKERLGTGESRRGRNAAQVAANLGFAGLIGTATIASPGFNGDLVKFLSIAALAEAAADTVSSELGQIFGGAPRLITTFRRVEAGTDGGITAIGTLAGIGAAAIVAAVGLAAADTHWHWYEYIAFTGSLTVAATFGLLFDSLLGAIPERRGWLNNDAVNFLSTAAAVMAAIGIFIALFSIFFQV